MLVVLHALHGVLDAYLNDDAQAQRLRLNVVWDRTYPKAIVAKRSTPEGLGLTDRVESVFLVGVPKLKAREGTVVRATRC